MCQLGWVLGFKTFLLDVCTECPSLLSPNLPVLATTVNNRTEKGETQPLCLHDLLLVKRSSYSLFTES